MSCLYSVSELGVDPVVLADFPEKLDLSLSLVRWQPELTLDLHDVDLTVLRRALSRSSVQQAHVTR